MRARSLTALDRFEDRETPLDSGYVSRAQLFSIHDRRLRSQLKRSREITVGLPELVAELRALSDEHVMLITRGDHTFGAHFFLAGEPLRILQMVSKPPIRSLTPVIAGT